MEDRLAKATTEPDVRELAKEYMRSLHDSGTLERISAADDIRYTRWEGQTDDGRKHSESLPDGTEAFPWEGASDTRIPLADQIINDLVDLECMALSRATLKIGGTESGDIDKAGAAQNMMRWQRDTKLYNVIEREGELLSQYSRHYGWSAMFVGWEQKSGKRLITISADDEGIPSVEDENAVEVMREIFPDLDTDAKAKEVLEELSLTGSARVPVSYLAVNQPCLQALKPWEEISVPPETTDFQSARAVFRRVFLTEAEVRAKVVDEGWNEEWAEAVIKTAGTASEFHDFSESLVDTSEHSADRYENLIEIVYVYTRQVDKFGVPGIYCTVISVVSQVGKEAQDQWAKHELLDYSHGQYPFVVRRAERTKRKLMESRSVTEICRTWQNELKTQRDSISDVTSFETLPPITVQKRVGVINKIGPAVQITTLRDNDIKFMDPPRRSPVTAFQLMEELTRQVDSYFGRPNPAIPPAQTQVKQQRMINSWLTTWTEIYQQMFQLSLQYLEPEEIARITGTNNVPTEDLYQFDFILKFDVRELDPEFVSTKLSSIAQYVVPQDVGGVLDRNRLISMIVRAISPDIAEELIVDQTTASQKMYEEVQGHIGQMLLGNEPVYVEQDPAAGAKLQYAQEIVGRNPKAQQALQEGGDELFQALFQNYLQNLQMSISQQQNAQIGRIGVSQVT